MHFLKISQRIRNQSEILRFLISFLIGKKKFFFILALLENCEAKRAKNGLKNQKMYLENVA